MESIKVKLDPELERFKLKLQSASPEVDKEYHWRLADMRTKRAEETKGGIPESVSTEERFGILAAAEESVRTNQPDSEKTEVDGGEATLMVGGQKVSITKDKAKDAQRPTTVKQPPEDFNPYWTKD